MLALRVHIYYPVWTPCWRASICSSTCGLYPALAPGSWFIWIHKWTFLTPGFQLGFADGGTLSGDQRKKGKRERLKYLLSFSLWDFLYPFCILPLKVKLPSSSPLPFKVTDLFLSSSLHSKVGPCCY